MRLKSLLVLGLAGGLAVSAYPACNGVAGVSTVVAHAAESDYTETTWSVKLVGNLDMSKLYDCPESDFFGLAGNILEYEVTDGDFKGLKIGLDKVSPYEAMIVYLDESGVSSNSGTFEQPTWLSLSDKGVFASDKVYVGGLMLRNKDYPSYTKYVITPARGYDNLCKGNPNVEEVEFNSSIWVNSIREEMFNGLPKLKKIILPAGKNNVVLREGQLKDIPALEAVENLENPSDFAKAIKGRVSTNSVGSVQISALSVESASQELVNNLSGNDNGAVSVTSVQESSSNNSISAKKPVISVKKNKKNRTVNISWKKINGVKKYTVQCSSKKSFAKNYTKSYSVKNSLTKKKVELSKNKVNYVRVRGIGGDSTSKWSKVVKVK